jgi:hypothetical protein
MPGRELRQNRVGGANGCAMSYNDFSGNEVAYLARRWSSDFLMRKWLPPAIWQYDHTVEGLPPQEQSEFSL